MNVLVSFLFNNNKGNQAFDFQPQTEVENEKDVRICKEVNLECTVFWVSVAMLIKSD